MRGTKLEWIDVDVVDRTAVREVSGQKRVPVAEIDGEIVVGSLAIVAAHRSDALAGRPGRARGGRGVPGVARPRLDASARRGLLTHPRGRCRRRADRTSRRPASTSTQDRFEALLDGRDYLLGDELSIADVAAYPFVKYATDRTPGDDYAIHEEMRRLLSVDGRPRVAGWIERVASLARA